MSRHLILISLLALSILPAFSDTSLPPYDPVEGTPPADWLVAPQVQNATLYRTDHAEEIALSNGLITRVFRLAPNAATVGFDNLMTGEAILRGVKPEASITVNGVELNIGGLLGQPNYAFLKPEWLEAMTADPEAFRFTDYETGPITAHMDWKQVRHHAPDAVWPPKGVHLQLNFAPAPDSTAAKDAALKDLRVTVHYNLYDGIPLLSKWIAVHNGGVEPVTLDRFTSEILAVVEQGSYVESRDRFFPTPNMHVETDYAFSGMTALNTSRYSVHWKADPDYETQVNYLRTTPCLLEVSPEVGPAQTIAPGETFTSFRAYELIHDSTDRERQGLAQRRMYRVIAPWVTENPLMMHARYADRDAVTLAIDQAAEVGFEMVILTFGSGFNLENKSPRNVEKMTEYAAYAASKGIEIGGYSLLSSRTIDDENDVVMPEGQSPTFGHAPCLESEWGQDYFRNLYAFYETTGFNLLEHDGSYPGDVCMATNHPGHKGLEDSRWNQWTRITDFYKWCRAEGIYLNVPDFYYLAGSNKCGMGYRETNWSLPRDQQVIHARQNIYDGAWEKTPSMGWMFVPLTEYHGGGKAATIEPLADHLDHYRMMLNSNLAMGVQACYRGPRLYDTDETKAMVSERVAWFKQHRDILESDLIHGRRADSRDLDWMLHVNPTLEEKGMLVVFNPLDEEVTRTLSVNLYYTGLKEKATLRHEDGEAQEFTLDRDYTVPVKVTVPAHGLTWHIIEAARS